MRSSVAMTDRPLWHWLLLAAALGAFLWLLGVESQRQWFASDRVVVVAGERHFHLSSDELSDVQAQSRLWLDERSEQTRERLHNQIDDHLEQLFGRVEGQIPEFLDWYYSLRGEYSRLGMSALSALGLTDADHVADRASDMLFESVNWEASLMRLNQESAVALVQQEHQTREGWLAEIMDALAPHEVPAPIPGADAEPVQPAPKVSLDALNRRLEQDSLTTLNERLAISAGGGVAAGVALWRGAARSGAALTGRQAAARGATRGAGRAGSAAAGGGAVCAPGGPVALGCALVAGTAAWLTLDWALLKAEEGLRRDAMQASLEESLESLKTGMAQDLKQRVDATLEASQEQRAVAIDQHFLPMRTASER